MKYTLGTWCILVIALALVPVSSQEARIDYEKEISSGFISGSSGVDLWHVWLNTSGTHLLFLAMYSAIYPSPINYFVGLHYFTANGTEVFVGNRLLGFEVYEDINKNSVIDADYSDGYDQTLDEARYYFLLNASLTADLTPATRSTANNVTHYKWSVKYTQVQGNLAEITNQTNASVGDPDTGEWFPSLLRGYVNTVLDFLNLSFDYWIENNVAYLKTNQELGTFTVLPWSPEQQVSVQLNQTSLSMLYTMSVTTLEPYSIETQDAIQETSNIDAATVSIEQKEAFRLAFGENYTLNNEPTQHKSSASTYSINSLPGEIIVDARYFSRDAERIFREQLGNSSSNLSRNVTLSIQKSSLIYRECYPTWSNQTLSHDPLLIAHIGKTGFIGPGQDDASSSKREPLPLTWLVAAIAIGTIVLGIALREQLKIREHKFRTPTRN